MPHDELDVVLRDRLRALADDPNHYGVLVPREHESLGYHAIDVDTAELLRSVASDHRLSPKFRNDASGALDRTLARLVLDAVLEIDTHAGFVSGPAAHEHIFVDHSLQPASHPLVVVAHRAIRGAVNLPTDDVGFTSRWLYARGRLPVTPRWRDCFRDSGAIEHHVGIETPSSGAWDAFVRNDVPGWISWRRLDGADDDEPVWKLYVSPRPGYIRHALEAIAATLDVGTPASVKLGADVYGLLRPDCLIVYFDDEDGLRAHAEALRPRLDTIPAHGVPFTAPLDDEGLLSWGVDPPADDRLPGWRGVRSWRVWVTDRLARSVHVWKVLREANVDVRRYALDRISLDGVDPSSWCPIFIDRREGR